MPEGTVDRLALELGKLLRPLETRLAASEIRDVFSELGLEFPPALETQAAFVNALTGAATSVGQIAGLIPELVAAIEAEDDARIVQVSARIIGAVGTLIPALETIGAELGNISGSFPGMNQADVDAFAAALPLRLLDFSVGAYLEDYYPVLLQFLALVGIVDVVHVPGVVGDPTKPPHTKRELKLERLSGLLSAPEASIRARYGWGDGTFDGARLLQGFHDLLASLAVPVSFDAAATPPELRLLFLGASPTVGLDPPGVEASLLLSVPAGVVQTFPLLVPEWEVEVGVEGQLDAGVGMTLQPPAQLEVGPPSGSLQGRASIGLRRLPKAPATSVPILSIVGGSRLEAGEISARLLADLRLDSPSNRVLADFGIAGDLKRGKLVITMEEADGFLRTLLAGFRVESEFGLGFGWTAGGGVYFTGSSTLEIELPAHIALGPIDIEAIRLGVGLDGGELPIALSVNMRAELGPLQAVVEEIGLEAALRFPPDRKGNLGPVQLDFRFKPPKGAGLSVDTGVVVGGGYLFFDPDRGEYAGVLELELAEIVSLKAIGLITTRMPDGTSGFSLLIILTAEFGTGIQLGFGFTLLAVGGLIGLNRAMRLQPLAEGMRTGAIESVMFPQNVVANAPKIISDLRTFFPPEEGKTLIGPMAKLGWGTPTLVSLSIGVIIEIPGNVAIVGILKIALPTEEAALIVLQVNFIGAIEFDKQRFWFFAALYESRVVFMTIEGEMGVLAAFDGDANFVLSVGGFHPQFSPPPLPFPSPRRVSVNVLSHPLARIRVDGYFAVTTNTAQFGARAELFFGFSACSIEGHLGFDALFQFSPFRFIIEISFSVSLKVFGMGLFGIRVRFSLEGPSAWRAKGTGSISFFFFDIEVDFDRTWGEGRDTSLPPIAVMPLLEAEVRRDDNWRASLPTGTKLLVSLRQLPAAEAAMVMHPVGTLKVSQRAVPLDVPITKVGNQKPSDGKRFSLLVDAGELTKIGDVDESFAPAQYDELGDGDKLSRPAYEPRHGGIELSVTGNQLASGAMIKRVVRYDLITIDTLYRRVKKRFFVYTAALFAHFLKGASVSLSVLSAANEKKLQPFEETVTVGPQTFAVALVNTNATFAAESAGFTSVAVAQAFAAQAVADDPSLAGSLHVIPQFEVAA